MECFTVAKGGTVSHGIATAKGSIAVGEVGRGRRQVLAPLPEGRTLRGELPGEKGDMLATVPGDGACVLLRDQSGFRGGWTLRLPTDPERVDQCATDKAAWVSDVARLTVEGHEYPHSEADGLKRERDEAREKRWPTVAGSAAVIAVGGKVIAEGHCADGAAGNMGGGPEYLLKLPAGAVLVIARAGRLYGAPSTLELRVAEDGAVTVLDLAAATATAAAKAAW